MRRPWAVLMLVLGSAVGATWAANPPVTVNYQGVLRDAADKPRNGTFDMSFSFYSSATPSPGAEIFIDVHSVVAVTNGLFNVRLGAGNLLLDGQGPGSYSSLDQVFRDFTDVWMQVVVVGEQLLPLVHVESSPYALNAAHLGGYSPSDFLDTSANAQAKIGPLQAGSPSTVTAAVRGNSPDGASGQLGGSLLGSPVAVGGYSPTTGGVFYNDAPSYAALAYGVRGVEAVGAGTGGAFENFSYGGRAYVGTGRTGIEAFGIYPSSGGHFVADDYAGEAFLAIGDTGILARGNYNAGEFQSAGSVWRAYLGSDWTGSAGYFEDNFYGVFAYTATAGYGLLTNGSKNFLQNHPTRPDRAIAYTALEGPESGTYTRGHGTLRGSEARIPLDPTFALTTDPDIGLTAIVTPRGAPADLYVVSVSTSELVVRSAVAGGDTVEFDYLVNGLRAGFENAPVIVRNAPFPSAVVPDFDRSEARLREEPEDVRASTPRARFSEAVAGAADGSRAPELAGARALIAGINSADHRAHARAAPAAPAPAPALPESDSNRAPASMSGWSGAKRETRPDPPAGPAAPARAAIAPWLTVAVQGIVEAGDVLANDPDGSGVLRRSAIAGDPGVVGIVTGVPAAGQAGIAPAGAIVTCKVDATSRPVATNDLLIASPLPGFAMAAGPEPRAGTVLGKALEPLEAGTGLLRVLVMSR